MFIPFQSKELRARRRAWLPWALVALPGLSAGCGDDDGVFVVDVDAGPDAAATAAPSSNSDNPSPSTLPHAGSSAAPASTDLSPTSEPESTSLTSQPDVSDDATSAAWTTTGETVVSEGDTSTPSDTTATPTEPATEVDVTSAPTTATTDDSADAPTTDSDTTVVWPGGDSTGSWTDGGASTSAELTVAFDAGVADASTGPFEPACGPLIGTPSGDDAGTAGGWPEVDGGTFADGLLVNGSFDTSIDGWTSQANPNGIDTVTTFVWESDGGRVLSGPPHMPNAQVLYQDFTVPSSNVDSAVFAFDVVILTPYYDTQYGVCFQDLETLEPMPFQPHDGFRVDIVASNGDVLSDAGATVLGDAGNVMPGDAGDVVAGDAGVTMAGDAGVLMAADASTLLPDDAGVPMAADAGNVMTPEVFTSPILFELFAPNTATYGVQHIVFDDSALAEFLNSHQGETLRLRFGVVSSSFPIIAGFDNVSLHVGM